MLQSPVCPPPLAGVSEQDQDEFVKMSFRDNVCMRLIHRWTMLVRVIFSIAIISYVKTAHIKQNSLNNIAIHFFARILCFFCKNKDKKGVGA